MGAIAADSSRMKIEHFLPQSKRRDLELSYPNLLGACRGSDDQPSEYQHCDTRKADSLLSFNPADVARDVATLMHFPGDGNVSSTHAAFDQELNEVLNLNLQALCNRRRGVLTGFLQSLGSAQLRSEQWEVHLARWEGRSHQNQLNPYCGVVTYYIRKKLRRLGT